LSNSKNLIIEYKAEQDKQKLVKLKDRSAILGQPAKNPQSTNQGLFKRIDNNTPLKLVAARISHKLEKDITGTKFSRRANIGLATTSAIELTAGITALSCAGAAAVLAWPFFLAVGGVAATIAAGYGIYKLGRHLNSQAHKSNLTNVHNAVNKEWAQLSSDNSGSGNDRCTTLGSNKAVLNFVAQINKTGRSEQTLNAKDLSADDLQYIADWTLAEFIKSDSKAAARLFFDTIKQELSEMGADSDLHAYVANADGDRNPIDTAADFMAGLGISPKEIVDIYQSVAGLSRAQGDVQEPTGKAIELLMKQLSLR
jgi:hypothetical protein